MSDDQLAALKGRFLCWCRDRHVCIVCRERDKMWDIINSFELSTTPPADPTTGEPDRDREG